MDHIIHTLKSTHHSFFISHISDKETELVLIFFKFICHQELLELISGIDDDLLRIIMGQHIFGKALPKGSGSSGNKNCFII